MFVEMTDLEEGIIDRLQMGFPPVGPLTAKQQAELDSYETWMELQEAEQEAQDAAGGRLLCPECGRRTVVTNNVCTYGHPRHPEAEWSVYYHCEACPYEEL